MLNVPEDNAWVAYLQGEYRRMYAGLIASSLSRRAAPDERTRRHIEALSHDFYGALGLAEGLLANKHGYSVSQALTYLEAARDAMPSDCGKQHKARLFERLSPILALDCLVATNTSCLRVSDLATHLAEPGHTARFWALVNRYPKAERARGYLMAKGLEPDDEP